jgi:SurA N-terminal domain
MRLVVAAAAVAAVAASVGFVALKSDGDEGASHEGRPPPSLVLTSPANGVAKVGNSTITKEEFDRWLKSVATGRRGSASAVVPDPPGYEKCVAGLKSRPELNVAGSTRERQLEGQCRRRYDKLKDEVMQFLITSEWVEQEAKAQDVEVSDREIESTFQEQKKRAFPGKEGESGYQKFLEASGLDESAVKYRLKGSLLQRKLQRKVTKKSAEGKPLDAAERQRVFARYVKGFRRRYRKNTTCAVGFRVAECANGAKLTRGGGRDSGNGR